MSSEEFFDLLLNFGDNWQVDKVNYPLEEVDVYIKYVGLTADSKYQRGLWDLRSQIKSSLRHLDTMQFNTYINVKSSQGVNPHLYNRKFNN